MIIPQGYPLWIAHIHDDGSAKAEAVIAWNVNAVADNVPRPLPVTATCGELDPGHMGAYLDTEAEAVRFRENVQRAVTESREADLFPSLGTSPVRVDIEVGKALDGIPGMRHLGGPGGKDTHPGRADTCPICNPGRRSGGAQF